MLLQVTLLEGCPVAELPRFMPDEWRNILDWYDATVCTHTLRLPPLLSKAALCESAAWH